MTARRVGVAQRLIDSGHRPGRRQVGRNLEQRPTPTGTSRGSGTADLIAMCAARAAITTADPHTARRPTAATAMPASTASASISTIANRDATRRPENPGT